MLENIQIFLACNATAEISDENTVFWSEKTMKELNKQY